MEIPQPKRWPRFSLMALALVGLLAGLYGGLLRIGWDLRAGLAAAAGLPMAHGPLMVCGFLGTLISLERAVALERRRAGARLRKRRGRTALRCRAARGLRGLRLQHDLRPRAGHLSVGAGVPLAYRGFFYGHAALLHGSLAVRLAGDLGGWPGLRRWGGLFNAAAILLFLANTVLATLLQQRAGSAGGDVVTFADEDPLVPAEKERGDGTASRL